MHADDIDAGAEPTTPIWAVFGDLMAGLLGAFVLILAAALGMQLDLSTRLEAEVKRRQAEEQRREALEKALAIPLATGRVTLNNGRIGISNSVLFAFASDQLQPEGRHLMKSLAAPLAAYLASRDEILMVSGFTDDRLVRGGTALQGLDVPESNGIDALRAQRTQGIQLASQGFVQRGCPLARPLEGGVHGARAGRAVGVISTRRLRARPSGSALEATGCSAPKAAANTADAGTPSSIKARVTVKARWADSSQLSAKVWLPPRTRRSSVKPLTIRISSREAR